MEIIILIIYGIALSFVFLFSLIQLQLVLKYKKYKTAQSVRHSNSKALSVFPMVTVQLPLYNEKYVAERLLESIAQLDYPKDLLEIQVLDDSTDETIKIVAEKVRELKEDGFNVKQILRTDRSGYKAGALANGLTLSEGEFIAIFDADFLPRKDFLQETLLAFENPEVGMVQTKWQHINKNYSSLTKLQAFGLDAHFTVEQGGRNAGGHFMNFNGTAGIWRKTTILDSGSWQSDTLTEDLDLSYRAQLRGWKFIYLEEIGSPAELPVEMNALRTQQFRWNKGAAECARKNLSKVLASKHLFSTKLNAIFHLMNSAIFICILLMAILSVPTLFIKNAHAEYELIFKLAGISIVCLPMLAWFYWTSFKSNYSNNKLAFLHFMVQFPMFLAISMGLSLHNSIAVFEGYLGRKTPFVRTPKFNLGNDSEKKWKGNSYLKKGINPFSLIEIALSVYFVFGIYYGITNRDFGLIPFHLLLSVGFLYVGLYSFLHSLTNKKST